MCANFGNLRFICSSFLPVFIPIVAFNSYLVLRSIRVCKAKGLWQFGLIMKSTRAGAEPKDYGNLAWSWKQLELGWSCVFTKFCDEINIPENIIKKIWPLVSLLWYYTTHSSCDDISICFTCYGTFGLSALQKVNLDIYHTQHCLMRQWLHTYWWMLAKLHKMVCLIYSRDHLNQ
jgi:hypothetical protein